MAIKGKKIGFEKVIKMIDEMVATPKQEQLDDDHKKEHCAELQMTKGNKIETWLSRRLHQGSRQACCRDDRKAKGVWHPMVQRRSCLSLPRTSPTSSTILSCTSHEDEFTCGFLSSSGETKTGFSGSDKNRLSSLIQSRCCE